MKVLENETTDERLLIEAAQRDPTRFAELYENNFDRVYAYLAHRVGNRDEAEECRSRAKGGQWNRFKPCGQDAPTTAVVTPALRAQPGTAVLLCLNFFAFRDDFQGVA